MLEPEYLEVNMQFSVDQSNFFMFLGITLKHLNELFLSVVEDISKHEKYVWSHSP